MQRMLLLLPLIGALSAEEYFQITVVDQATGRGVPMVELRTENAISRYTDSHGHIAWNEPGLMDRPVYFEVRSHGYRYRADGLQLATTRGGKARIEIARVNIAERLYRITGQGIYRDTLLTGGTPPLPDADGGVLGQDSAQAVVLGGRVLWIWGDTSRAAYPLGNFHGSGAWSSLDDDPDVGIRLHYLTKDDLCRAVCPMEGPGPVWLDGLCVVEGRLLAHYARMKSLGEMHEHGLAEWDASAEVFRKVKELPLAETRHPKGHPVAVGEALLFGTPLPSLRVPATRAAVLDPARYEEVAVPEVGDGQGPLKVHAGSISWNEHRRRWILVLNQAWGTSMLGEVWYAEADAPVGPWTPARKIVSHDDYSFYNVVEHPFLARGRHVYFEGTYASTFSGTKVPTPRYDYNQVMYRLDLDDPRLR